MRKYGLACDNLISADIVTAEGDPLSIDKNRNADLFWGIRGGGGNFGIVTSFEFRVHPVSQIYGGMLMYPLDQGKQVLRAFRQIANEGPDELGMAAGIATHPEIGRIAGVLVCHTGSLESGEKLLRPLRAISPIAVDQVGPCFYTAVQSIGENFNPRGFRNYWKSNFLRELGDDLIDLLIDRYPTVPAPHGHFVIEAFGGAVSRVENAATAFNNRAWPFNLLVAGL